MSARAVRASRAPLAPACEVFEHVLEVRPSDLDAAGHLNHVRMLAFFEHGRVRAHADVRAAHPDLGDVPTVVRVLEVDYLGQAAAFDSLLVRSWVARDGGTSRTWAQELVREGEVIARARVTSVWVERGRPARLGADYRELFARWREPADPEPRDGPGRSGSRTRTRPSGDPEDPS